MTYYIYSFYTFKFLIETNETYRKAVKTNKQNKETPNIPVNDTLNFFLPFAGSLNLIAKSFYI